MSRWKKGKTNAWHVLKCVGTYAIMAIMIGMVTEPAYATCPECQEPNPDFDPDDPYETDPPCNNSPAGTAVADPCKECDGNGGTQDKPAPQHCCTLTYSDSTGYNFYDIYTQNPCGGPIEEDVPTDLCPSGTMIWSSECECVQEKHRFTRTYSYINNCPTDPCVTCPSPPPPEIVIQDVGAPLCDPPKKVLPRECASVVAA